MLNGYMPRPNDVRPAMIAPGSIVVISPAFEDAEAFQQLLAALGTTFPENLYVIAVDDGSIREPLTLDAFNMANVSGEIIKLRRNVGHQQAIAVGLAQAAPEINDSHQIVIMDSDGEDLPSSIPALLALLGDPQIDAVVAQRKARVETLKFKIFYEIYKLIFRILTGQKISFGNFMALKPRAVKRLVAMQEASLHVAGALIASRLRITPSPQARGARYAQQSKMNFVNLVLHGFKGLMVFAENVFVRVGIACAILALLSIVGGITAILLKVLGVSTPGWFSIALGLLLLIFMQTAAFALITFMVAGIIRSKSAAPQGAHLALIDETIKTNPE